MRKINLRTSCQEDCDTILKLVSDMKYKVKYGKTYTQKPLPYWEGMPRFSQIKKEAFALFTIETDLPSTELTDIFQQNITDRTKSIWFPKLVNRVRGKWVSHSNLKPQYPVYIISKDRPRCMTANIMNILDIDYKIVVEPVDVDSYKEIHGEDKLLVLPFSNLGQGSIPVRNWVWGHSTENGYDWHWILDDNIEDFNYLTDNTRDCVRTSSIFRYAEDFVNLHDNIGQAGFNYYSFCKGTDPVPPYYVNTRIYSCILINNSIPFRWRGKYNEDTDLSIRILKSGMCTLLFNAFMAGKVTTMRMKGGNTDNVYIDNDNRYKFAESLYEQHPDIVRITQKFGRWHHQVNYKGFTQKLNRIKDPEFDYYNDLYFTNKEKDHV
jgi:hypothetical protein